MIVSWQVGGLASQRGQGRSRMRAPFSEGERERITPHAFRHMVATRVVRQGALVTAADLLEYSSLSTTRCYVKATIAELEAAVETLYDVTKADTE